MESLTATGRVRGLPRGADRVEEPVRCRSWRRTAIPPLALALSIGACATGRSALDQPPRPAYDVPARFVLDPTDPEGSALTGGPGCRNPLFDPRDATRIRLVRSAGGRGDYEVPSGRYGVGARELLRLDCANGEVVGVVGR